MTNRWFAMYPVACLLLALAGCGSTDSADVAATIARREAIVLLAADYGGSWPAGLDPATSTTGRSNLSQMNAIFGGLFQLGPTTEGNGYAVQGVLAQSYEITDHGRAIVILC